jgi:hypothetical protein
VKLKSGTRSVSSSAGGSNGGRTSGAGMPSSAYSGASAATSAAPSDCDASIARHAKRLTPKGRSVSSRIRRISTRSSSGPFQAPPYDPSAPAFDTAATSSGVVAVAMGARRIG